MNALFPCGMVRSRPVACSSETPSSLAVARTKARREAIGQAAKEACSLGGG